MAIVTENESQSTSYSRLEEIARNIIPSPALAVVGIVLLPDVSSTDIFLAITGKPGTKTNMKELSIPCGHW